MTGTKQKQFTAMIERACPGTVAALEAIAAETTENYRAVLERQNARAKDMAAAMGLRK